MLEAFRELGYDVDVVSGYGKDRKASIQSIKGKINQGHHYDFVYSETSTMPTLLTEKHHLPTYPFLDFGFFKFCRSKGIKIGLFYRDIYWAYDGYKQTVPFLKRTFAVSMYRYDLSQYKKLVDVLYVPTGRARLNMASFFPVDRIRLLPPASETPIPVDRDQQGRLRVVYVGGVGGHYDMTNLFQAMALCPEIDLDFCCRVQDWLAVKADYEPLIVDNIRLHHLSGEALQELLKQADIAVSIIRASHYISMAMPFKIFEYLQVGLPIIAAHDTAVADFVKDHGAGWSVSETPEEIAALFQTLARDRQLISQMQTCALRTAQRNQWTDRARQVVLDLS